MADSLLKKLSRNLSATRKSQVLSLVFIEEPIIADHLLEVQDCLAEKSFESLDVVVHSGGGDINVVYQIAELLRRHCKKMTLIIPIYAKSAATLLILAADEIITGELAELGPLDTQIAEKQKGSLKYNSALNPFKSLEQLQSFSLETMDATVKLLLNRAELTVDEAIGHGIEFASRVSSSLYSKLDIEKLGEYSRALAVGEEYGTRLMRRYTKWQNEEEREDVLDTLLHRYPSHDYIIDHKELKELGFGVRYPTGNEKPLIDAMVRHLVKAAQTEIFCVFEPTPSKRTGIRKAKVKESLDDKK